jgi:hypothetical protein
LGVLTTGLKTSPSTTMKPTQKSQVFKTTTNLKPVIAIKSLPNSKPVVTVKPVVTNKSVVTIKPVVTLIKPVMAVIINNVTMKHDPTVQSIATLKPVFNNISMVSIKPIIKFKRFVNFKRLPQRKKKLYYKKTWIDFAEIFSISL